MKRPVVSLPEDVPARISCPTCEAPVSASDRFCPACKAFIPQGVSGGAQRETGRTDDGRAAAEPGLSPLGKEALAFALVAAAVPVGLVLVWVSWFGFRWSFPGHGDVGLWITLGLIGLGALAFAILLLMRKLPR